MPSGFIKPARLLKLAVVIAIAFAFGACGSRKLGANEASATPFTSQSGLSTTTNAQALGWAWGDGTRAQIADYKGKVLVLDFYATWCEPCRDSIPKLIALQKVYGPNGLQIVGLNVGGPDDRVLVSSFANSLGIIYPLGFPDKALTDAFVSDDTVIPQTLVFGRDGNLIKTFVGYDTSVGSDLEKVINDALGK